MDLVNETILVGAGLIVASIFSSLLAFRMGAPLLLVFLMVGLLGGAAGAGGLMGGDARGAYFIGSIALAIILFDSGFQTGWRAWRLAAWPAGVLATAGIVLTTAIVGGAAHALIGLNWGAALLLGAAVSSTDAAAVFFLLRVGGITVRERVRATLEAESGTNDPMAILLTLALVPLASGLGLPPAGELALNFLVQMGGGALAGLMGGAVIVFLVNRLRFDPGLYPLLVMGCAVLIFAATNVLGGSGFLAAYAAGLLAGNSRLQFGQSLRRFQAGLTWLSQIMMFVTLGLLAQPALFPELLPAALALSAVLILLARPAAVLACLWPFRFSSREMVFLSWVGLRGAVSILLALVPLLAELPEGQRIFNTTFLIVVISLGIQGWTVRPLAHRLGLIVPKRTGPVERLELELPGPANHELVAYTIREDSPLVRGVRLPRWARPVLVQRQGQVLDARSARAPQAGDRVYLFTAPARLPLLDRLFGGAKALADDDPLLFGEFSLDPDSILGAVAAVYGATIPADKAGLTLAELFRLEFRDRPEIGDRIHLGSIDLIARDIESDRLTAVGLAVDPRQRRRAGWLARLLRSYTL